MHLSVWCTQSTRRVSVRVLFEQTANQIDFSTEIFRSRRAYLQFYRDRKKYLAIAMTRENQRFFHWNREIRVYWMNEQFNKRMTHMPSRESTINRAYETYFWIDLPFTRLVFFGPQLQKVIGRFIRWTFIWFSDPRTNEAGKDISAKRSKVDQSNFPTMTFLNFRSVCSSLILILASLVLLFEFANAFSGPRSRLARLFGRRF